MNRRHKILGIVALSLLPLALHAQSEHQAFRLASPYEPFGSARSAALSGAMGAVGSDVSSIIRNPAGISLFRGANRLSFTLQGDSRSNEANWYGQGSSTTDNFKVRFQEFSYQIGTNRASRGRLSFALAIRNAGRYDRTLNASASLAGQSGFSSLADYAAARTNNGRYDFGTSSRADDKFSLGYLQDPKRSANDPDLPFISIFGTGAGWIAPKAGERRYQSNYTAPMSQTSLVYRERGSITDYDLALGVEVDDALHLGIVGTLSSLDHELNTYYEERYGQQGRLSLQNVRTTSGFGGRLGAGLLYELLDGLRLGASIYTPTFYSMRESFRAVSEGQRRGFSDGRASLDYSPEQSYRLRGAWRFGLSGAYLIGQYGFLSVDYDYATLGHLRLSDAPTYDSFGNDVGDDAGFEEDNARLKTNYQGVHTVRIGAEALLSSRVSLRGGYRYSSSPIKNAGLKGMNATTEVLVPGPTVHYSLPDAVNSFSAGLGWRVSPSVTLDLAYVYTQQKGRTFAFPYVSDYGTSLNPRSNTTQAVTPRTPEARDGLQAIEETNTRHQAVATVSFRF